MKIKRLHLSTCCYCNQIAVGKIDDNYYCNYHLLKEELLLTVYKIENLPGVNSSFPDYNRGDLVDYKKDKENFKNKVSKESLLDQEKFIIVMDILRDLDNLLTGNKVSLVKYSGENDLLSVTYKGIEYIFSWKSSLDYNRIKEYLSDDTILLVYSKKNNKIIKYY